MHALLMHEVAGVSAPGARARVAVVGPVRVRVKTGAKRAAVLQLPRGWGGGVHGGSPASAPLHALGSGEESRHWSGSK
jgi:hypothetical protein